MSRTVRRVEPHTPAEKIDRARRGLVPHDYHCGDGSYVWRPETIAWAKKRLHKKKRAAEKIDLALRTQEALTDVPVNHTIVMGGEPMTFSYEEQTYGAAFVYDEWFY